MKFTILLNLSGSNLLACGHMENAGRADLIADYLYFQESLIKEVPQGLKTDYDSGSGGFYDNTRMNRSGEYKPGLQSTAIFLTMLSGTNSRPLDSTCKRLRFHHQSDGGFMKNQLYSGIAPNAINLERDSVNIASDLHNTHLAGTARNSLYKLSDRSAPEKPFQTMFEIFFNKKTITD